jgi:putative peptidoglycan lipid II flippase
LFVMVPHAIITVSLATAILPRLSAKASDGDLSGLAATLAGTVRIALAVVVPFAFLLPLVAYDAAKVLFGYGATATTFDHYVPSMILFGPGVVFFTVHYLMLRGFYALERTRTVFWVQCVIAVTNVVLAIAFTSHVSPAGTAPGLVLAYAGAYLVGALTSYSLLRRTLGGLDTPVLLRFLVRLLVAAGISTSIAWAVKWGVQQVWAPGDGLVHAASLLAVTGAVDVVVFLALARAMRITEVTSVMNLVTSRLRR